MSEEEQLRDDARAEEPERAERPLKILFFSHYFPPEGNAPANRTYHHCKVWAEMGHKITVITCAPNCPDGVVYEGYKNKWMQREMVDGIEVIRVWTYIAANKGFARRILNYLSYMFSAVWRAVRLKGKPDVIIATSPQFFCGWAGVLAKWLLRRPFVLEIRDIWPESIVAVGALRNRTVIRVLEIVEERLYRNANAIVTVGLGYKKRILERGVGSVPVEVVMNGVDAELQASEDARCRIRQKLGLQDSFVVCYAGTIGMAAGLSVVLRAAALLRENDKTARYAFLLVGSGANKEALELEARAKGLTEVHFTGRVPRDEVPDLLAASDAVLVHLRRSKLFESVIPSKIFEASHLGLPIVVGVEGEASELVAELGAGLRVAPDSAEDLAHACREIQRDLDGFRERAKLAAARSRRDYSRAALAAKLELILSTAVAEKNQ